MADLYNVLFLCSGNSGRSIIAESVLRKDGAGRFNAFSAGSRPKGEVNRFALWILEREGYPTDNLSSKSWDVFSGAGASEMDFVFTVCDEAAGETCPVWPGHPATARWGIEDPAKVGGNDVEKERAFVQAFHFMRNRIEAFLALPIVSLDKMSLHHHLHEIGRMDGTTQVRA